MPFRRYSVSAVSGFVPVRVGHSLSLFLFCYHASCCFLPPAHLFFIVMSGPALWAWPYLVVSLVFYPTANHCVLPRILPVCWQVNGTPDPVVGGGRDVGTSMEASGGRRICVWRYARLNAALQNWVAGAPGRSAPVN